MHCRRLEGLEHRTESMAQIVSDLQETSSVRETAARERSMGLEKLLRDVCRNVQILRDKAELAEATAELAKLSSSTSKPKVDNNTDAGREQSESSRKKLEGKIDGDEKPSAQAMAAAPDPTSRLYEQLSENERVAAETHVPKTDTRVANGSSLENADSIDSPAAQTVKSSQPASQLPSHPSSGSMAAAPAPVRVGPGMPAVPARSSNMGPPPPPPPEPAPVARGDAAARRTIVAPATAPFEDHGYQSPAGKQVAGGNGSIPYGPPGSGRVPSSSLSSAAASPSSGYASAPPPPVSGPPPPPHPAPPQDMAPPMPGALASMATNYQRAYPSGSVGSQHPAHGMYSASLWNEAAAAHPAAESSKVRGSERYPSVVSPSMPSHGYAPQPRPSSPYATVPPGVGYSQRRSDASRSSSGNLYPQAHPGAPPRPQRDAASTTGVPLEKVIDDVAVMGFSREQVRKVLLELSAEGKAVDLNVVLDRLGAQ